MGASARKTPQNSENRGRLRRLAVQIAAQLPEDTDEALAVLGYAQELVEKFLREPEALPTDGVVTWLARN